jgi:hypothetical protein
MNGHPYKDITSTGLISRKAVGLDGDFVLIEEIWNSNARDFPMCAIPRGAPMPPQVGRRIVIFRAEAHKLGLL